MIELAMAFVVIMIFMIISFLIAIFSDHDLWFGLCFGFLISSISIGIIYEITKANL